MNTLSWLIYAESVASGLRPFFSIMGGALAFAILVRAVHLADIGGSPKRAFRWLWAPMLLALIAIAIPSSRTIYMIAASEAGEAVVTSPDAIEMMGDLKAIIKKRLKEQLGE